MDEESKRRVEISGLNDKRQITYLPKMAITCHHKLSMLVKQASACPK